VEEGRMVRREDERQKFRPGLQQYFFLAIVVNLHVFKYFFNNKN